MTTIAEIEQDNRIYSCAGCDVISDIGTGHHDTEDDRQVAQLIDAVPHLVAIIKEAKNLLHVRVTVQLDQLEHEQWDSDANALLARMRGDVEKP